MKRAARRALNLPHFGGHSNNLWNNWGMKVSMIKRVRRVFTKEFKVEAVRLAQTAEGSVASIARNLGVFGCISVTPFRFQPTLPSEEESDGSNSMPLRRKELATVLREPPKKGAQRPLGLKQEADKCLWCKEFGPARTHE